MARLTYRDTDGRAKLTPYGKKMYCSTQATADCICKLEERLEPLTDEQAIEHLQASGWMQAHDKAISQPVARVMTQQELKEYLMINESGLLAPNKWQELEQRNPVYMEYREPDRYQVNWRTTERLRSWAMEPIFWEKYGTDRRCWTSRPTDEQRKAVKWDE